MKKFLIILLFTFNLTSEDLTLEKAYELTLNQSENLKINLAGIRQADARYNEAVASIFPNVRFLANERVIDGFSSLPSASDAGFNNLNAGRRKDRFQSSINITQPLFSGFREFLAADAVKAQIESQKLDLDRLKQTLYLDVANLFYQILLYEKDLKVLKKTNDILLQRVKEIEGFVTLGKSRESEKFASETDLADNLAEQAQVNRLLLASKEMFAFLTGIKAENIKVSEIDNNLTIKSLDDYLQIGSTRNDLIGAAWRVESAQKQLKISEREKWPSLNLESNVYTWESPEQDRNLDLLVRMEIPLFNAGRINSRIDQQKAVLDSTNLQKEQLRRRIEEQIRVAYANYSASLKELDSIKLLLAAGEKNYQRQKQDYAQGVVTNLDVLQSIRQLQDAKRRLLSTEINLEVTKVRLIVSAGSIK